MEESGSLGFEFALRIESRKPKTGTSTDKMERRKTPRASVCKLACINFEPYNTGGVITELSASGLRFHTVAPLQQGGVLRLSLVFAGMNQLEVIGEVVWTDSTRKIGCVRFVVLPPDSADQIRNWLENSANATGRDTGAKSEIVPATQPGALSCLTCF